MEDFRKVITASVKAQRLHKGWSQTRLAEIAGMPQSSISRIEAQGYPFSLEAAYRLAEVFGVTVHAIIPPRSMDVAALLTTQEDENG